jgi:malate permease and related proteins
MFDIENPLLKLYATLIGWVLSGLLLGRILPKAAANYLGQILFWFGVPILIIASLRGRDLSGDIWIAPVTAWIAIAVGAAFAWIWIDLGVSDEQLKWLSQGFKSHEGGSLPRETSWSKATQGSFLLAMMVGNTGYMGFPVILTLVGKDYFVWGLIFDLLGSTLGAYGLGVAIAAHFGNSGDQDPQQRWWKPLTKAMLKNPALWSLMIGLTIRNVGLPEIVEQSLKYISAPVVPASLIMIGMQLSKLTSLGKLRQSSVCLFIKMLLVPLFVGTGLMFFGITGAPRLALVLQMSMPPAFATLVIAQAYNLDRDLSVTAIAFGSITLLFTLPIWVWLFS